MTFCLLFVLTLTGCKKEEQVGKKPYYKTIYDVYNTYVSLSVYNEKTLNNIFTDFESLALDLHTKLDRHDTSDNKNNLSNINNIYGTGQTIQVSKELLEVLQISLKMFELTEGYFNPALGSLIDLWEPKFNSTISELNTDPSAVSIQNALKCVPSIEQLNEILIINENTREVTFNELEGCNDKVVISLGAIGKGYAMDKLKEFYQKKTTVPGTIDGGSSSLLTVGENPLQRKGKNGEYDHYWNIGVNAPYPNHYQNLFIYQNKGDLAVSTSGNSVQFFYLTDDEGNLVYGDDELAIRRTHILNPYTGYSENFYDNISLISTDAKASVLDALSTAIYNVGDLTKVKNIINRIENEYNVSIDYSLSKTVKVEVTDENNVTSKKQRINVYMNQGMFDKSKDHLYSVINSIEIIQ